VHHACESRLRDIVQRGRVAIDNEYLILTEYLRKTAPHAGKRAGDIFIKLAPSEQRQPEALHLVALEVHDERGLESFPRT